MSSRARAPSAHAQERKASEDFDGGKEAAPSWGKRKYAGRSGVRWRRPTVRKSRAIPTHEARRGQAGRLRRHRLLREGCRMKAILPRWFTPTRLRPLTDTMAKPLLPLAGRPWVAYIYDKIAEVPGVDAVHLVTNHIVCRPPSSNGPSSATERFRYACTTTAPLTNADRLAASATFTSRSGAAKCAGRDLRDHRRRQSLRTIAWPTT